MQRDSDHADSGKPRTFVLCEKKHEWVCSNASTSLKNPLLVRVRPMCLSVKLHLCRFRFMQYRITWLVRIRLCRLVEIRLNRWDLVLTSEWILSVKLYLLWRVFMINLLNLQNLRGVLILVSLSVVVSTYRSAQLSGLCSKVLLIALDEIPDVCNTCF